MIEFNHTAACSGDQFAAAKPPLRKIYDCGETISLLSPIFIDDDCFGDSTATHSKIAERISALKEEYVYDVASLESALRDRRLNSFKPLFDHFDCLTAELSAFQEAHTFYQAIRALVRFAEVWGKFDLWLECETEFRFNESISKYLQLAEEPRKEQLQQLLRKFSDELLMVYLRSRDDRPIRDDQFLMEKPVLKRIYECGDNISLLRPVFVLDDYFGDTNIAQAEISDRIDTLKSDHKSDIESLDGALCDTQLIGPQFFGDLRTSLNAFVRADTFDEVIRTHLGFCRILECFYRWLDFETRIRECVSEFSQLKRYQDRLKEQWRNEYLSVDNNAQDDQQNSALTLRKEKISAAQTPRSEIHRGSIDVSSIESEERTCRQRAPSVTSDAVIMSAVKRGALDLVREETLKRFGAIVDIRLTGFSFNLRFDFDRRKISRDDIDDQEVNLQKHDQIWLAFFVAIARELDSQAILKHFFNDFQENRMDVQERLRKRVRTINDPLSKIRLYIDGQIKKPLLVMKIYA